MLKGGVLSHTMHQDLLGYSTVKKRSSFKPKEKFTVHPACFRAQHWRRNLAPEATVGSAGSAAWMSWLVTGHLSPCSETPSLDPLCVQ